MLLCSTERTVFKVAFTSSEEGAYMSLKIDPTRRGTRRDLSLVVETTHNLRSRNANYLGIAMRNGNAEYVG